MLESLAILPYGSLVNEDIIFIVYCTKKDWTTTIFLSLQFHLIDQAKREHQNVSINPKSSNKASHKVLVILRYSGALSKK